MNDPLESLPKELRAFRLPVAQVVRLYLFSPVGDAILSLWTVTKHTSSLRGFVHGMFSG